MEQNEHVNVAESEVQGDANAQGSAQEAIANADAQATATPTDEQIIDEAVKGSKVPEQYAEKGWVKKVVDEDGNVDIDKLLKQVDNLDSLVGKKEVLPDVNNAEPAELDEFFGKLKPAAASDYNVEGVAEGTEESIQEMLYNSGVPKHIADKLIPAYLNYEKTQIAELYSAEGLEAAFKGVFGENHAEESAKAKGVIEGSLSAEDLAYLNERVPNQTIALFYKFANALTKDYLINETSKTLTAGSGSFNTIEDAQKEADEAWDAVFKLKNNPNATAQQHAEAVTRHRDAQTKLAKLKGVL